MIMRLPGTLAAGEARDQIVNLVDLRQATLDALEVDPLPHADGKSFWSVARNASASWQNETFREYCTDTVPDWTGGRAVQQRIIRAGQWKLCLYNNEPPLLFHLGTDPDECTNQADDPACADVLQDLMGRLTHNWDPAKIAARMQTRRVEKDLLANWAQQVGPEESYIWRFPADTNQIA